MDTLAFLGDGDKFEMKPKATGSAAGSTQRGFMMLSVD